MQTNKEMIDYLEQVQRAVPKEVFNAMRVVDRREFLPEGLREEAYQYTEAIPIGYGQTCSAPDVVSDMCGTLGLKRGQKVLEVGSGCFYHGSVTAEIIYPGRLISLEIVPELAKMAKNNLSKAKKMFKRKWNAEIINGDGSEGFRRESPYDRIYFTAGIPTNYPMEVLSDQLVEGGRFLLAPQWGSFILGKKKDGKTTFEETSEFACFVHLQGKHGDK